MGVFVCPECQKTMQGTCSSCKAWYCDDCYNWHCDPAVFPPASVQVMPAVRLVLSLSRRLSLLLLCLCLFSACDGLSGGVQPALSLVGRPSLTVTFIDRVLADHHSPAQGLGYVFYDLGVQYGIDSAFPLAFFGHESNYGLLGEAVASLSIGNIRCLPGYLCRDGYAWFSSWAQGIRAWYVLVSGPLYVGAGLTTLSEVVHRYAPSSDSNNEVLYVQSVAQSVTSWRSGQD